MNSHGKRRRGASIETVGNAVVVAVLISYVVFITGRIASAASATGVLLAIGGSLLAGAFAAAAGAAWGRHDEPRPVPVPRPEPAPGNSHPRGRPSPRPRGQVVVADA